MPRFSKCEAVERKILFTQNGAHLLSQENQSRTKAARGSTRVKIRGQKLRLSQAFSFHSKCERSCYAFRTMTETLPPETLRNDITAGLM